MSQVRVALVCPEDRLRMAVARAFDAAPPEWDVSLHRTVPDDAELLVSVGCELPHAIAFDPLRPDQVIDDVRRRVATRDRKLITVVGASGGCGASTVAIHLAAETSSAACLVEFESPSSLEHRLGLEPGTAGATPIPVPGGFKVANPGDREIAPTLAAFADAFEVVVADSDPSTWASLTERSSACVLVLNPTLPSAGAACELLAASPDVPWALVTNRVGPGGETSAAELQRALGRRLCLELPCSRRVRDAEGECRLVSPHSFWRRRVSRLARTLELR